MKAFTQRMSIAALLLVIAMAPACSNDPPPETTPTPPPTNERPAAANPQPVQEDLEAGDWNSAETGEGVLSLNEINDGGFLQTVYFDYDQSEIRPSERAKLQANAQFIRENQNFRVLIAGHCDERGTREYNMALGERRASATMQYLVSLGVPRDRVDIISYGEEQPAAMGSTESAWQQNRRAVFTAINGNDS